MELKTACTGHTYVKDKQSCPTPFPSWSVLDLFEEFVGTEDYQLPHLPMPNVFW